MMELHREHASDMATCSLLLILGLFVKQSVITLLGDECT
jgi:hypothetical protein